MANANVPCGFAPKGDVIRQNAYQAGGTVYPGDLVKLDSAGKVVQCDTSASPVGAAMTYATSGNDVIVADHPSQMFIALASAGEIDAQTDLNLNYLITLGTASTLYRVSRAKIDSSSGASNSNYPLKVIRIVDSPDNALGSYVQCICTINTHQLNGETGSVGV